MKLFFFNKQRGNIQDTNGWFVVCTLFCLFQINVLTAQTPEFATWTETTNDAQGRGTFSDPYMPDFTWTTTGSVNSVAVDNSETFSGTNSFETIYGQADSESNLNPRLNFSSSNVGDPIDSKMDFEIVFDSPTPCVGSGGSWSFCMIDFDSEQAFITAKDDTGADVPLATINSWFQEVFDANGSGDDPIWDPGNTAVIGAQSNTGTVVTNLTSFPGDSEAGGIWFTPDISLSSFKIDYQVQGVDDNASMHMYIATINQTTGNCASVPFSCSPILYQSLGNTFNELDPVNGQYNQIGPAAIGNYNAVGYNILDDLVYATGRTGSITDFLVQIDATGTVTPLANIGLNGIAGDMDRNGNLWVEAPGGIRKVSVTSPYTVTDFLSMTNSPADAPNDIVHIPSGGNDYFYGVETDGTNAYLYEYDITNNIVNQKIVTGLLTTTGVRYGAAWTDVNNNLYVGHNAQGEIFRIDGYEGPNPVGVSILVTEGTPSNDGASCPIATSFSDVVAADDNSSTEMDVAVVVDVLANDHSGLSAFDFTSVSNTGLLQPANGSLSINTSNGEVTYTPSLAFIGQDSFEYKVCNTDMPTPSCDTATVYVTVICPSTPGQNIIEGTVFQDDDGNGSKDTGETGPAGIDIVVYEDNNQDGMVDGGDTQVTTVQTDANGDYTYTLTLVGPTQNFTTSVVTGSDDAEEDTGGGVDLVSSDLELLDDSGIQVVGVRFTNITIPQGAIISDARIEFYADGTLTSTVDMEIHGQDADDAPTFTTGANNISSTVTRPKTTASVPWTGSQSWTDNNSYQTPNIDTIVQEIVDRALWTSGNDMVFIIDGTAGALRAESFDGTGGPEPKLIIDYAINNLPAHYVMEVDQTDLPSGATMTTDTVATAVFTATGQTDCANNFGFVTDTDLSLIKTADITTVTVGDTVTYTLKLFNGGPSGATGVTVADTLDANLTYVSSNGGGTYDSGTHLWTISTIPNGDSATINILATVDAAGSIMNKAEIYASDLGDPDSTPNNNTSAEDDQSSLTITGVLPDIAISKSVDNATPNVGANITFTVTANNIGLGDATGVQITDVLPTEFTYVSDDSGGNYNTGSGVWTVGDLTSMASATLNITVTANKVSTPTNTAQLTAIDQTDTNTGNDQGSIMVTIDCTTIKAPMTLIKN